MKSKSKKIVGWTTFAVTAIGSVVGGIALIVDNFIAPYQASNDLPLLADGAHLKKGTHRVVIGDQFYDMLTYDTTKEEQSIAINGIKEAYTTLNSYNSKLKFELCTVVDGLEEYGIKKISGISKSDIPLYITEKSIDGHAGVLAETNHDLHILTRELCNSSITYKKEGLFGLWDTSGSEQEMNNPKNSLAYSVTAHESMHLMGIDHISGDSIMNTYMQYKNRDFTESDKKLLDKYNVQFYKAKSYYANTASYTKEEDDLSF